MIVSEINLDWKERYKSCQRNCNKHVAEQKRAEAQCRKAERAFREIALERDRWKERALKAEAALASMGALSHA